MSKFVQQVDLNVRILIEMIGPWPWLDKKQYAQEVATRLVVAIRDCVEHEGFAPDWPGDTDGDYGVTTMGAEAWTAQYDKVVGATWASPDSEVRSYEKEKRT